MCASCCRPARWATAAADDRPTRDSLLLTIMLHARLEIASNSTREWHIHPARCHGRDAFSREVLDFALSCLSMEGIFHATTTTTTTSRSSHWPAEIVSHLRPSPSPAPVVR